MEFDELLRFPENVRISEFVSFLFRPIIVYYPTCLYDKNEILSAQYKKFSSSKHLVYFLIVLYEKHKKKNAVVKNTFGNIRCVDDSGDNIAAAVVIVV